MADRKTTIRGVVIILLGMIFFCWGAPASALEPVRVGIYPNPPMLDYDESGRPQGLFADVVAEIAKREGWAVEYVLGSFDESLQRLAAGEIALLPTVAHTPERARLYNFNAETVFSNWGQVFSQPGSKIQSILDLDGKTVAVMKGSVLYGGPDGLKRLTEKFSLQVQFIELSDFAEVSKAVRDGLADAGLFSRVFESSGELSELEKPPILLSPVSVRIAFAKNSDPALLAACDRHLRQLKGDPQSIYYQSLGKWLGGTSGATGPGWLRPLLKGMGISLVLLLLVLLVSRIQVRRGLREISRKNRQLEAEITDRHQAQKELARQTIFFEAAINSLPDGLVLCNPEREIVRCNPAMTRVFGYHPQDLLGQKTSVFYASFEEYEQQGQLRFNMSAEQKNQPYVVNYRRKDGSVFPGETLGTVVRSESGEVLGYLGAMRDITDRRRSREALQWELRVNRAIAELGRLMLASSSIEEISEVILQQCKELTGSPHGFVGFIDPQTGDMVSPTMTREVWAACRVPDKKHVFHAFKGLWGWVLTHRQPILCNEPETDHRSTGIPEGHVAIRRFLGAPAMADGALLGIIALANAEREYHAKDLELLERLAAVYAMAVQNMRTAQQVRESEERFRTIFEHAGAGMNTIDIDGRYLQVNPTFCRFVGYSAAELKALCVEDLTHPDDLEITRVYFNEVREGKKRFIDYEKRFLHSSGKVVWGYVTTAWMMDADGRPHYGIGLVQDISERKLAETRLQENEERFKYLAHHDNLTGLPNRLLFADRLQHAMSKARRSGGLLALLFFDLDRFKAINDCHGHEAGDQVLQAVARRLLAIVRDADTVARFGGDEFIVLLEDVQDVQNVEILAGKILLTLAEPLSVRGQQ
ncbi:PAS domain S-box protein, partial [Trichloromonas sp.]|uniref:PAS domain S-box protein n=1 Tax=Trichloromonas sp. TaxID=3069249 RepID=UPI003D8193C9